MSATLLTVDVLVVLLGVVLLALLGLALRRRLLLRGGGTVDCSLRLRRARHGRGWAWGVGRYAGDRLTWYRVFSASPRPRHTVHRRHLAVQGQRRPHGAETLALMSGAVVLECRTQSGTLELAMSEGAAMGFLSWLESAPPGQPGTHRGGSG